MIRLRKGILIAIEGIDGAGKTTQARRIGDALSAVGFDVVQTKEPTSGKWGTLLRESAMSGRLPPERELHAFLEDRREHVAAKLRPAIEAGKIIIVDRYYFSTAAYQGARGMDPDDIIRINEEFAPKPDLLVLLDVDPNVGVARIRERGDGSGNLFEREEDLRRSADIFGRLARTDLLRLDGRSSPDAITSSVLERLYWGPVFDRMCHKDGLTRCEPAFCIHLQAKVCKYPEVGQLAPVPLRVASGG